MRNGSVQRSSRLEGGLQLCVSFPLSLASLLTPESADTIMVQSLSDSSLVGFTDAITIAASSNNSPDPADTSVTLLTIPAPTSTNLAGSTSFSGKIPRPTAVTDVATAEAATTSASRGTGTGTGMVLGESKAAAPTTMAVGANSGAARVGGAMGAMLGVGAAVALLL